MSMPRCLPCLAPRCSSPRPASDADEKLDERLSSRLALLLADAPAAETACAASLAIARSDSVRAQWQAAASGVVRGGRLARRATSNVETLRRAYSFAAALLPAASRLPSERGAAPATVLDARLAALRLRRARVPGDGNCLFRALAAALFNNHTRHAEIRAAVAAQLRSPAGVAAFSPLFPDTDAYLLYADDMATNATWGDELALAAAAEAFGMHVTVIQDTPQHWLVAYAPSNPQPQGGTAQRTRRAFVAYTAPVHYDAIVPATDNE
jgi:hypothetical protein